MYNKANLLNEISMLEKKTYSKKNILRMKESELELANKSERVKRMRNLMESRNLSTSKISDMSMLNDKDKLLEKFRADYFKHLENFQTPMRKRINKEEKSNKANEERKIREGYSKNNKPFFKSYIFNEYEDIKNKIYELEKVDNGKWLKVTTAQKEFGLPNPGGKCDKNKNK